MMRSFKFNEDGPIKLGNLILDPHRLEQPFFENIILLQDVHVEEERDWKYSITGENSASVGLAIALGFDVKLEASSSVQSAFECDRLVTKVIFPSEDKVQANSKLYWLNIMLRVHKRYLYMVTGIKIAHGARLGSEGRVYNMPWNEQPIRGLNQTVDMDKIPDPVIICYRLKKSI